MVSRSIRIALAIAFTAGILCVAGCTPHATIAEINKDPGRYAGKDVTLQGTVSEAFAALGNGVFQIDDGTGRIWVYSQSFGVPANSSSVSVTGKVEQGFAFGGRTYGVILRQTEARK